MRGSGDPLTVGERIAFYRRRRALTQLVLANLVGRSEDWLSKIERGERDIRRLDVLADLARVLRVSMADLLGQPVLMEDEEQNDDVPAVRDALMAPRRLSRILYGTVAVLKGIDITRASELVEFGWSDYQRGRLGQVIRVLPGLIQATQRMEDAVPQAGSESRACWAVSARTHHLAATTLSKIGEADLAWIAAERAMYAADQADDALVLASAARAGTHALLAVGRFEDALDLGNTAAEWLRPQIAENDPNALSLYGMLHLRTAVAAARHQDRQAANELLGRARHAADQLGEDANHWQTSFGPTNVELHRLSAALDLGDISYVVDRGPDVTVDHLPTERGVSHLIDLARALSLVARDDEALQRLLEAESQAPAAGPTQPSRAGNRQGHVPTRSGDRWAQVVGAAWTRGTLQGGLMGTLGVVGSGAGGVEQLRSRLIEPAQRRGWTVAVTLTPTAGDWLTYTGELHQLEETTGLPVRFVPRMPHEQSPHPPVDCYVVAPASANTVAKLALGLADNQALTTICEAIGGQVVPVVVFPRVNAAHARQPAWAGHLDALRFAGVHLVYGDDVWPLYEPRSAPPGRELPWGAILDAAERVTSRGQGPADAS